MAEWPETPLVDAVAKAVETSWSPMQIPGHKQLYKSELSYSAGVDLLFPLISNDIPLQGCADDNQYSNDYLGQAERLYAQAIGAERTRFLVNGGSQGNLSAFLCIGGDGQRLAVDRTAHRSAWSGLMLNGAVPVWIYPERHPEFGIPIGMKAAALDGVKNVTGVFVTSPGYVGTMSDIAAIAKRSHKIGAPLVVDQAWGAHLDFGVPGHKSALAQGADMAVTSIHKALLGYTQTAIISTAGSRISVDQMNRVVDMTMTTSPSGTLMASIDASRAVMEKDGQTLLAQAIEWAEEARAIMRRVPGLVVIDESNAGCPMDPLKIVLWLPRTGVKGTTIAKEMWDERMGVESADIDTVVMTISVVDQHHTIEKLGYLICALVEKHRFTPREPAPAAVWGIRPETAMTPRAAVCAPRERVPLKSAVGRVSCEQFTPYPPGVPLIGPGEVVTEEIIEAIATAKLHGRVAYCSDPSLETIEVISE